MAHSTGLSNRSSTARVRHRTQGYVVITFTVFEKLAKSLPGTSVSTSYGTPAIKVGKKLLLRLHQKEDAIVVLLGSVEEQQQLIAEYDR